MTLTDTAIKNAKSSNDKPFRLTDEKGMYLLVHKNGSKYFRLDYRFKGIRKTLALGVYPETSLKHAREQRDTARQQIADGIDPSKNRKAVKSSNPLNGPDCFEVVAREWYSEYMADKSEGHKKRTLALLQRDLFPCLGAKSIDSIKPPELLEALRAIKERGALETAHRALQTCGQVFRYAISTGRPGHDISRDLKGVLPATKPGHFSAVTDPDDVAKLLRTIYTYEGTYPVVCALRLAPLVFVRPNELRSAEWSHIDFEKKEWRYKVTKTKTDHIVPLSRQAIEILTSLQPYTGNGRYVFPSARVTNGSRPMSDVALLAALRRMGIPKEEATIHGFRALARTILDEVLQFRPDFIEHQLAHAVRDPNGRAYNRTTHLAERHKMMQVWADYLDDLKNGADTPRSQ